MFDPKWLDYFKDSDTQFVAGVVAATFLAVHWLSGWPSNLSWWVVPMLWLLFLSAAASLTLKFFGVWIQVK